MSTQSAQAEPMFGAAPIGNVRGAIALIERDPPEQVPTREYSL